MNLLNNNLGREDILTNFNGLRQNFSVLNATGIKRAYCFNEGTFILCLSKDFKDVWIPVEELNQNTLVKTYKHGYRRIRRIITGTLKNDINDFSNSMRKMKLSTDNELFSELIITSWHGILVDEIEPSLIEKVNALESTLESSYNKIDDKYILPAGISNDFESIDDANEYTYYHFSLEYDDDENTRYGVWANGVLTETTSEQMYLLLADNLKK
jgi:hypothetical protein